MEEEGNYLARLSLSTIINFTLSMPIHRWVITNRGTLFRTCDKSEYLQKAINLGLPYYHSYLNCSLLQEIFLKTIKTGQRESYPESNRLLHSIYSRFPLLLLYTLIIKCKHVCLNKFLTITEIIIH